MKCKWLMVFAVLLTGLANAQDFTNKDIVVSGFVSMNGKKMEIKDGIILWTAPDKIRISLYPFPITKEEREQKINTTWLIIKRDVSPAGWESAPSAVLGLNLNKDDSIEDYMVSFLTTNPSKSWSMFSSTDSLKVAKSEFKDNGKVEIVANSNSPSGDDKFSWDISIKGIVHKAFRSKSSLISQ